ncbi:MAG: hypothetical protein GEV06_25155 [Luteitalea sp.]|nr:hypothetical protein [Luteitalea sp.]
MRALLLAGIVAVVIAYAAVQSVRAAEQQRQRAARAFEPIATVLSSARCANCHISGAAPLQGDDGRPHTMLVRRGLDGRGTPVMRCTNCHQDVSAPVLHAPPGAPDWRLPPPSTPMAWKGLSVGDLCRRLIDPSQNGNRRAQDLLEHLRHDPLVLSGWSPGPGRTLPPVSHDAFVKAFATWIDLGAVCPE